MNLFGRLYLDKEKDIIIDLMQEEERLFYTLRTPNHGTGNLIRNLAGVCGLSLTNDENGFMIIENEIPCYFDGEGRLVYVLRLGDTKVANIYPDGRIEQKAMIPSIAKTLMSQTKDYRLDIRKTLVKTYIRRECKFRTDLHTHMNANLHPDVLIALGIRHQIRYPLYYIKKLKLVCTAEQEEKLKERRAAAEEQHQDSALKGKYLTRRIDDNTFINFADLILKNPEHALENIAKIRCSLAVMKDGQAVFTNLEKVYLYRYVFTKGITADDTFAWEELPDVAEPDIAWILNQMKKDMADPVYGKNTLFQNKLLWVARSYQKYGVCYAEISDTTLVKKDGAAQMLSQVHAVMPRIIEETGVTLRFLAGIRRIPLTIVRDQVTPGDYFRENLQVLRAIASDPYVAGSDIIGEEINDIREISAVIGEIVRIATLHPGFTVRIHAGENDCLRDNLANSIACVKEALEPGEPMPPVRIGHGLYAANLKSASGKALLQELVSCGAVLEFQITSNVRLNNLSTMERHPLRQYLESGVRCVQGTDGGALYGTDSVDEQLALERMLNLSFEEMCRMRACEEKVRQDGMAAFAQKKTDLCRAIGQAGSSDAGAVGAESVSGSEVVRTDGTFDSEMIRMWYQAKIDEALLQPGPQLPGAEKMDSEATFAKQIKKLPVGKIPIVVAGGSFNSDRHKTVLRKDDAKLIDLLLEQLDPEQVWFAVGHRVRAYERYLMEQNADRFPIFSYVPSMVGEKERKDLSKQAVGVRVAIESEAMGVYKSIAYEIFKRGPSVLITFDGNSAGVNLIQEAKNAKYPCRIYADRHSRVLKAKSDSLEGYVKLFDETDVQAVADEIAAWVAEWAAKTSRM